MAVTAVAVVFPVDVTTVVAVGASAVDDDVTPAVAPSIAPSVAPAGADTVLSLLPTSDCTEGNDRRRRDRSL